MCFATTTARQASADDKSYLIAWKSAKSYESSRFVVVCGRPRRPGVVGRLQREQVFGPGLVGILHLVPNCAAPAAVPRCHSLGQEVFCVAEGFHGRQQVLRPAGHCAQVADLRFGGRRDVVEKCLPLWRRNVVVRRVRRLDGEVDDRLSDASVKRCGRLLSGRLLSGRVDACADGVDLDLLRGRRVVVQVIGGRRTARLLRAAIGASELGVVGVSARRGTIL